MRALAYLALFADTFSDDLVSEIRSDQGVGAPWRGARQVRGGAVVAVYMGGGPWLMYAAEAMRAYEECKAPD